MRNFAKAPWGHLTVYVAMVRVLFAVTLATPSAEWPEAIAFVMLQMSTMLDGVFLFTFGSWFVALIARLRAKKQIRNAL